MRKPNKELAEKRKAQILEAAMECFLKSGFHNSGMKEICATAKMSTGAVYRYFDSKDAIIEALVKHEQQELSTALDYLREAPDLKAALMEFMDGLVRSYCSEPDNIIGTEIFAESTRNKKVAKLLIETEDNLFKGLRAILKDAEKEGRIKLKLTPDETARTMSSLAYGLSAQSLLFPKLGVKKLSKLARKILDSLVC